MKRHFTFAITLLLGALLFFGVGKTSPAAEPVAIEARSRCDSYGYNFLLYPEEFKLMVFREDVQSPNQHAHLSQLPKPSETKRQL